MTEVRRHPRFQVNFGSMFSGAQFAGNGTIADLSVSGCSITSKVTLTAKSSLALQIELPDSPWPLHVERAIVQWAKGNTFGVEFEQLSLNDTDRLHKLIQDLEHGPLIVIRRANG